MREVEKGYFAGYKQAEQDHEGLKELLLLDCDKVRDLLSVANARLARADKLVEALKWYHMNWRTNDPDIKLKGYFVAEDTLTAIQAEVDKLEGK